MTEGKGRLCKQTGHPSVVGLVQWKAVQPTVASAYQGVIHAAFWDKPSRDLAVLLTHFLSAAQPAYGA